MSLAALHEFVLGTKRTSGNVRPMSAIGGSRHPAARPRLPILTDTVEKSKIVRRQKSRKCWFLDTSAVDARRSANTPVRGRFSEKGRGPSHRCTRNVSAALRKFRSSPPKYFFNSIDPSPDIESNTPERTSLTVTSSPWRFAPKMDTRSFRLPHLRPTMRDPR